MGTVFEWVLLGDGVQCAAVCYKTGLFSLGKLRKKPMKPMRLLPVGEVRKKGEVRKEMERWDVYFWGNLLVLLINEMK